MHLHMFEHFKKIRKKKYHKLLRETRFNYPMEVPRFAHLAPSSRGPMKPYLFFSTKHIYHHNYTSSKMIDIFFDILSYIYI